jgi:polyhydroxyalkanoate synthesis regulator phasin
MATKKEETASFMLRFTQKIFESEKGEPQIQWRGNIRHVQGGDEKRFSEFDDVVAFIQSKLQDLTIQAMEDKTPEEQKGILSKSFDLWKKMATEAPKLVMDTIKDPKKQVAHIQGQIQDQISHVKEEIGHKLDLDSWLNSTKSDSRHIMEKLEALSKEVAALNKKVDKLKK